MNAAITQSPIKDDIYLGFWINWSYGSISGATLTLTQRDGGLLAAFLALFVTIAGTSFWRIACFALHHLLSSKAASDGIYQQRQAILRNAANGASGLWSLLRMSWVWRKHTQAQPHQRILPLIVFTLTTLVAFTLAGIFSSRVSTSMGNEVLLLSSNCGVPTMDGMDSTVYLNTLLSYITQRTVSSANYAQECYRDNAVIQDCPTFLKKSLPWTSDDNIGCPFPGQEKICRGNSKYLRLDTGYINSNFDLGINTPSSSRFLYRSLIECAPLNTEGYSEQVSLDLVSHNASVIRYYYGEGYADKQSKIYQYSADPPPGNGDFSASPEYTIQ
jgi:hypothetical protein